ncbi:hypothetical protein V8C86DRAFT_2824344 [Haematococcus lacustris]
MAIVRFLVSSARLAAAAAAASNAQLSCPKHCHHDLKRVEVNTCPMLRQRLVALSLPSAPARATLPAPPPLLSPLSLPLSLSPLDCIVVPSSPSFAMPCTVKSNVVAGAVDEGAHHTLWLPPSPLGPAILSIP